MHCFYFCCGYMSSLGLLDSDGKPNDLCSIVTYMFFTTPANIALVSLLRAGVFEKIYASQGVSNIDKDREAMLILCYLFWPIPIILESQARLPALPGHARGVLTAHNRDAMNITREYWSCFTQSHAAELGPDNKLPLSNIAWPAIPCHDTAATVAASPPHPIFSRITRPTKIRSHFLALTKPSDRFATITNMCASARTGLLVDPSLVPIYQPLEAVNSFMYDFYKSGDYRAVVEDSGVSDDSFYAVLVNFTLLMKTCCAALERREDLVYASVETFAGFKRMAETMQERLMSV